MQNNSTQIENEYFRGKTAVVTGGSQGIGRAIAVELAGRGANVVICARGEELLKTAVVEIEQAGGQAAAAALDLRLTEAPGLLVEKAIGAFGRIDILVNNAGATKRGEFTTLTEEDWTDGFALKFFGAVRLTREAWPQLRASKGSVVNIAGIGGKTPGPQFTIGGSVNAALLSFTKAMADNGIRDGVQVNAINPGFVRTPRFARTVTAAAAEMGVDEAAAQRHLLESAKIVRFGEPADIAGLVAFITGAGGRFLQGALIDMDGGQTKTL